MRRARAVLSRSDPLLVKHFRSNAHLALHSDDAAGAGALLRATFFASAKTAELTKLALAEFLLPALLISSRMSA